MSKYLLLGLLIVGVAVGSYIGCDGAGARMGVAADKAIDKIDDLLGKIDVKQKKVENAFAELKEASSGVREKRIEAQVRLKSFATKKAELESTKKTLVSDLGKLMDMMKEAGSDKTITRNGKEIAVTQLKALSETTMKKIKSLNDKVSANNVMTNQLAKNLEILKKHDDTSGAQLKKLGDQLDQIKSKKSTLDAMKEAASIAGPSESISDKFNDLTDSVDELLVDLETEWEVEKYKLDERMNEMETSESSVTLEDLLKDEHDVSETLSEMEKMLSEEGN